MLMWAVVHTLLRYDSFLPAGQRLFFYLQVEFLQLLWIDGCRGIDHHIPAAVVLREGNKIPDGFLPAEDGNQPVKAEGDAARVNCEETLVWARVSKDQAAAWNCATIEDLVAFVDGMYDWVIEVVDLVCAGPSDQVGHHPARLGRVRRDKVRRWRKGRRLGLRVRDLGRFGPEGATGEEAAVEAEVDTLNLGLVEMLDAMEQARDLNAFITVTGNSFGARWFDENWQAQFDQPQWKEALTFFVNLMNDYGPEGYATNGFNENLALFQSGKCGMWIDATVAASFVTDAKDSTVADKVGFALAPDTGLGKRGNWLWAWTLAIPAGSQKVDSAKKFIAWAKRKFIIEFGTDYHSIDTVVV